MRKSIINAANIYQASSLCWALYCAIPYAVLIFIAFYLWFTGIYLYFTHEETKVDRPSNLFKVT